MYRSRGIGRVFSSVLLVRLGLDMVVVVRVGYLVVQLQGHGHLFVCEKVAEEVVPADDTLHVSTGNANEAEGLFRVALVQDGADVVGQAERVGEVLQLGSDPLLERRTHAPLGGFIALLLFGWHDGAVFVVVDPRLWRIIRL
jgi:hypothetical protein